MAVAVAVVCVYVCVCISIKSLVYSSVHANKKVSYLHHFGASPC